MHKAFAAQAETAFAEADEILRTVAAALLRALIGDAGLTDEDLDALAARVAENWDALSEQNAKIFEDPQGI